jgi:hypothetical protein
VNTFLPKDRCGKMALKNSKTSSGGAEGKRDVRREEELKKSQDDAKAKAIQEANTNCSAV